MGTETPKPFEKLENLYPLTPNLKEVNLSKVKADKVEIASYSEKGKPHTMSDALDLMIPGKTKQDKLMRDAVLARAAQHPKDYNVSVVHAGDAYEIDGGFLHITKADKTEYYINLTDDAQLAKPAGVGIEVKKREDIKQETQKAWQDKLQAFDRGVLYDVFKALGEEYSDANRETIWTAMKGNADFKQYLKTKNPGNLGTNFDNIGFGGDYKKNSIQNLTMIEYLRWMQEGEKTKKPGKKPQPKLGSVEAAEPKGRDKKPAKAKQEERGGAEVDPGKKPDARIRPEFKPEPKAELLPEQEQQLLKLLEDLKKIGKVNVLNETELKTIGKTLVQHLKKPNASTGAYEYRVQVDIDETEDAYKKLHFGGYGVSVVMKPGESKPYECEVSISPKMDGQQLQRFSATDVNEIKERVMFEHRKQIDMVTNYNVVINDSRYRDYRTTEMSAKKITLTSTNQAQNVENLTVFSEVQADGTVAKLKMRGLNEIPVKLTGKVAMSNGEYGKAVLKAIDEIVGLNKEKITKLSTMQVQMGREFKELPGSDQQNYFVKFTEKGKDYFAKVYLNAEKGKFVVTKTSKTEDGLKTASKSLREREFDTALEAWAFIIEELDKAK